MMFTKNFHLPLAVITAVLASTSIVAHDSNSYDSYTHNSSQSTIAANTMSAPAPAVKPVVPAAGSQPKADAPVDMKKVSEAFGHFIGRHLKSPGVNFDLDSVIKGMHEGAEGKPAPMSDKEYEQMMVKVQQTAFDSISKENLKAAEGYLNTNSKAEGVVEIQPHKLQYKITKQGTGETVGEHGSPQINYTGKFIDGTTFGSSVENGGPVTIPLDQTIPGFSQGIAGMKEGEKRRLFVHPDLGYGTSGHLPPNSLLIFDIEVVKAKSPEKSQDDLPPLALDDQGRLQTSKKSLQDLDSDDDDYDDEDDEDDDDEKDHRR